MKKILMVLFFLLMSAANAQSSSWGIRLGVPLLLSGINMILKQLTVVFHCVVLLGQLSYRTPLFLALV